MSPRGAYFSYHYMDSQSVSQMALAGDVQRKAECIAKLLIPIALSWWWLVEPLVLTNIKDLKSFRAL